jgi:uncharacterized protein (DUF488 family)
LTTLNYKGGTRVQENRCNKVFTIGHSTLSVRTFLGLLDNVGVTAIADVRSSPFSRRVPQFNRNDLGAALKKYGVKYVFLGKELGGRPRSMNLYSDGVADYEKMALEPDFVNGLDRVVKGSQEHAIALMCSEHEPLDCHRCLLIGRALMARAVPVGHILSDGKIAEHIEIEGKLLKLSGSFTDDMFINREELLTRAYRLRAKHVAFREPTANSDSECDHVS